MYLEVCFQSVTIFFVCKRWAFQKKWMKCPPTLRHFFSPVKYPFFVPLGQIVHKKQKISQDGYGIRSFQLHDLNQTVAYVWFYIGDATFHSHLLAHEEGFVNTILAYTDAFCRCNVPPGGLVVSPLWSTNIYVLARHMKGGRWNFSLFILHTSFFLSPFVVAKPRKAFPQLPDTSSDLSMPQLHFWLILFFWVDVRSDVDNRRVGSTCERSTHPPTHP